MGTTVQSRIAALVLSFWAAIPLVARGVSFDQWLAEEIPEASAIEVRFEPAGDGHVASYHSFPTTTSRKSNPRYHRVPNRPVGGYLGRLTLKMDPSAPLNLPLSVKIAYYQVLPKDLADLPEKKDAQQVVEDLFWNRPMGLLDTRSRMRSIKQQHVIVLDEFDAKESKSLPLIIPQLALGWRAAMSAPLLSCCVEVSDAQGTLLAREMPVELVSFGDSYGYSQSGVAWVMDEPEADRAIRDFVGLQHCQTVKTFPPVLDPFTEVDALWMSRQGLDDNVLPPETLRKLVLLGLWVYGRDDVVSQLRSRLDLRNNDQVLLGGIARLNKVSEQGLRRNNKRHSDSSSSLWEQYVSNYQLDQTFPLENRNDLFAAHKKAYLITSLGVLGFFILTTGIGLPIAFCFLKGPRRLIVWYAVPVFSAVIALLGFAIGSLVLPRTMRSDITEYRFAYAGWPEVCCRSVARLLTYESPGAAWRLPPGSCKITPDGYSSPERDTEKGLLVEDRNGVELGVSGLQRGQIAIKETASFQEIPLPVEITWQTNRPMLKALADLKAVHVWTSGTWRVLGAVAAGSETDIDRMPATNIVYGLPQNMANAFPAGTGLNNYNFSPDPDIDQKWLTDEKTFAPAFTHSWIVVGVQDVPTTCQINMDNVKSDGRAVWVIQIPFEQTKTNGAEAVALTP